MIDSEVVVVGAGVVGLAAAAALARAGRSVLVVERNGDVAREITARNSEVIHAGLYYPAGTLKATLCVKGREALYRRGERLGIPHRRTGKLVVATTDAEIPVLEGLIDRAVANGVPGMRWLDAAEAARLEPRVVCRRALLCPESGIVDGRALSLSYAAEAERFGAVLVFHTVVESIEKDPAGYRVRTRGGDGEVSVIGCAAVVNAAGLSATALAERAGFDLDACSYRMHPCKGDYFAVAPAAKLGIERLVYPVPAGPGLGIHVTLDLGGRLRLGPDAEYIEDVHYRVDPSKAVAFSEAAGRYLRGVEPEHLTPDYAGVRPKLAGPGEAFRDFVVSEESEHGFPAFVNLLGIESPGLTAAGAIGDRVADLLASL